jgi:parallel beta-helix repeat protein
MEIVQTHYYNNTIKNSGLFPGMGRGLFGAIYSIGPKGRYEYNTIENTGRNGIWFHGDSSLVKNNFINNFCLTLDDAGGIYLSDWAVTYAKKIIGNIVLNAVGNREGIPNDYTESEGIYMDYNTKNVEISGNTIANCRNGGIKIHGASSILINQNTCFNNNFQIWLFQSNSSYPISNINMNSNIFFSKESKQISLIAKSTGEKYK